MEEEMPKTSRFYTISKQGTETTISLEGKWLIYRVGILTQSLAGLLSELRLNASKKIFIEPQNLERLDTAGASLLLTWINDCQKSKIEVSIGEFKTPQEVLFKRVKKASELVIPKPPRRPGTIEALVIRAGVATVETLKQVYELINFLGVTAVVFLATCFQPKKWKLADLSRHIEEAGINAIPIISVMAFMISVVLAYQGAFQLQKYGADIYTIDLTAIAILREMGVLLTSIMVAGRSGSAFAAEIGVMKVNEEIDALRTLGISPFVVLILPRAIALMIVLPLLTFWADMMGLLGSAVIMYTKLGITWTQFVNHLSGAIAFSTYGVGLLKAPLFAIIIALVGCLRGMQVTNSAESVGQLTTKAVVESILLVMLADALLSILFTHLNV